MLGVPEWEKRALSGKIGQDQGRRHCGVEEDFFCGYIVSGVHESRNGRRKATLMSCHGLCNKMHVT